MRSIGAPNHRSNGAANEPDAGAVALNPVERWAKPLAWVSAVYLSIAASYVALYTYSSIPAIALPRPSTLGDFLAGIFSPLAFLWLVYGYLLQRAELALQRIEISAMRKAQEDQAQHLERTAAAAEREAALAEQQHTIGTEPDLELEPRGSVGNRLKLRLVNHGATARSIDWFSYNGNWVVQPGALGACTLKQGGELNFEASPIDDHAPTDLTCDFQFRTATDPTMRRIAFRVGRDNKIVRFNPTA